MRRRHVDRRREGMLCSLALHLAVALLVVFGLSRQPPALPDEVPISVELVELGARTIPSTGLAEAGRLTPPPAETPKPLPPKGQPTTPRPPSQSKPQPERHKPVVRPAAKPPPPDDFTAMLNGLRHRRSEGAAPAGSASARGASDRASLGRRGSLSVADFLRAQIERHWEFDVRSLGPARVVVALHVVLRPDGSVSRADIVDDPRYSADARYRPLAESVRRAALVASPLELPAGMNADAFRDVILHFNPREAVR